MSAMIDAGRRGLERVDRLIDALADPARRERAAAAALLGYVALWTLYGAIAKGSQDIHNDMSEQFVLAQELAWGYPKHPPLAIAVVRVWFTVFPVADWAYYLLAMATVGLALWIAWRISARFLDGDKRVVGLALLTLVPFFNFHALKFNANTVLMPLWAATTLWFLRSFEERRLLDAALAGLCAAFAMYGKYWSVVLLAGLGVAALADRRRAAYFRSPAPWVTIAVGALALAPHLAWLAANDFAPFSYAVRVHGSASFTSTLRNVLGYLGGSLAYVAAALAVFFVAARPNRAAARDMIRPATPERQLAAAAFWATLLLPAVVAPLMHVRLTSLWSMSAFALLPVVLLSSPLVAIARRDAVRIIALAVVFPFVMVAAAPAIAFGIHRVGIAPGFTQSSALVEPIERIWRDTTDRPLRIVAGYDEFTDGVAFYMRNHPRAAHLLDQTFPPDLSELIERDGIVLLCPARPREHSSAGRCLGALERLAGRFPPGQRRDIEVARRYLGIEGKPARYLIVTIPPRR